MVHGRCFHRLLGAGRVSPAALSRNPKSIMKKVIYVLAGLLSLACSPAHASTDPVADFFDGIFDHQESHLQPHDHWWRRNHTRAHLIANNGVNEMIADHVSSRIGSEWVPTAIQIARIESGGNCGAVNRSGATGIFQVINPERFGVSRSSARTCAGGIAAGVSHMAACIAKGAHTHSQMLRCHNSGSPFGRVERAYRRYVS